MRGHLRAWSLLALPLVAALSMGQEADNSYALISLDIPPTSDEISIRRPTLRLDVLESTSPCGYGNVTVNNQLLGQDENGIGSGLVTTGQGHTILATWAFSCVHLEDEFQGQLMNFEVVSVDDDEVHDVGFVIQFQQMAPVSVSFVNGTASVVDTRVSGKISNDSANEKTLGNLDDELVELELMMRQLVELEHAISSKAQRISEIYDFRGPEEPRSFTRCNSLKCIVKTMYSRTKHMAGRLYGQRLENEGRSGGGPHWPFHRIGRPHWFPSHHNNGTHRGHSFSHLSHSPHSESPHFRQPPPFCRCAPPTSPQESSEEALTHSHLVSNYRALGDEVAQESLVLTTELSSGMGPTERPLRSTEANSDVTPSALTHYEGSSSSRGYEQHRESPSYPHRPLPFGHRDLFQTISPIWIVLAVVLLSLLIYAVSICCFAVSRRGGRRTCTRRCRSPKACVRRRTAAWAAGLAAIEAKYADVVRWLWERVRRSPVEDEEKEKEAIMRRLNDCETDGDNLSTTMEEEIARFRTVANVISDLVAAEEGRFREPGCEKPDHHSIVPSPPSPTLAFPDYASVDEELPAYDEGINDSRFVTDGFRYSPGMPCYTSTGPLGMGSSLDEHLGRKD